MSVTGLRVGIVDDHAVVRSGYRRILELGGMSVALEATDADTAYAALAREGGWPLDVLVVDLELPGRSGLELTRRIRHRWPEARILMFTLHDDTGTVEQCLRAGALGFVTKTSDPDVLVDAVHRVAGGSIALSPDVARRRESAAPPPHAGLGVREFDVLNALLEGDGVEAIARRLRLSAKTVANYQTSIRRKLGVSGAVDLMAYAIRHGLRH